MEGQITNDFQIVVLMVPFPAQGHVNQLLHLSNILTSYNIPVHFAGSTSHNHQAKFRLHGWEPQSLTKIHFHDLHLDLVPNPTPHGDVPTSAHLIAASLNLRKLVCQLLQELAPRFRRIVVIHDSLMASVVQDVKSISNAEAYIFRPTSAFTSFFTIWETLPEKPFDLDSDTRVSEIPSLDECYSSKGVEFVRYQSSLTGFQSGILYNTSRFIDGQYLELLKRLSVNGNSMEFAIGPLNPVEITKVGNNAEQRGEYLDWLDKQDCNSVIFVSFGSSVTMTEEQVVELADGLEKSGQKFIWVLRNGDDCGEDAKKAMLPEGYEERMKNTNRGIVVKDWADQLQILSHASTGGFMTHCGWNSCMESISMGVPMATWPRNYDQPTNSILVTDVLKIGIEVGDLERRGELVRSNRIETAVKRLMASEEGVEIRKRAVKLGKKVCGSVTRSGTSNTEMDSFVARITR